MPGSARGCGEGKGSDEDEKRLRHGAVVTVLPENCTSWAELWLRRRERSIPVAVPETFPSLYCGCAVVKNKPFRGRSALDTDTSFVLSLGDNSILAWAHVSKDPRIAAGQQSPLEKQILNLGGVHTTAARHLITQKCQEELETLCREQAVSLDYWLARAESHYNERMVEMFAEKGMDLKAEVECERILRIQEPKPYSWAMERERKQIERHIHRTGQTKEFKNKTHRQQQPPSETTLPKIVPEEHLIPKVQRRKQVEEREQRQIKDHQERMTRGRGITEEKLRDRILRKSQDQLSTHEKYKRVKKDIKEFERVIVYPLYQPCSRSLIKVNVLMEKSENRKEVNMCLKSCERKFLAVPPFLKSQIRQIN